MLLSNIIDETARNEYNAEHFKCSKTSVCQITQLAYEVKVIGVSGKIEGPSESNHYLSFCENEMRIHAMENCK